MSGARWSPILWGRTFHSDQWWRAVPDALTTAQLRGLVEKATVSGIALDEPRYLLARRYGHWIVGVACNSKDLSDSMNTDRKSRVVNTFVGWVSPVGGERPPQLAALAAKYTDWAGPIYRDGMGHDWELPDDALKTPRHTSAAAAPWGPQAGPRPAADGRHAVGLTTRAGVVELFPTTDRDRTWAAGLDSVDPFVLVVGWPRQRSMPLPYLTHACVDGLSEAVEVAVEDGLDIEADRADLRESEDDMTPGTNDNRPLSPGRRSSWAFWQRSKEIEQLTAELTEVTDRLAAAEQEIAKLKEALLDRRELPQAAE